MVVLAALVAGPPALAEDCALANADRKAATAFVADFGTMTPEAEAMICAIPPGGIAEAWPQLEEEIYLNQDAYWVDWEDSVPGLLDRDYHLPWLQDFLRQRGVMPLDDDDRAIILDAANPGWREDYYAPTDTPGELAGYLALRRILRAQGHELLIYDVDADGWGLLVGPCDAGSRWRGRKIGYVTIYSVEGFFGGTGSAEDLQPCVAS